MNYKTLFIESLYKKTIYYLCFCLLLATNITFANNKVQLVKDGEKYQLLRNGEPYFIKGAGGKDKLEVLKKAGGNSIRTWGAQNIDSILDEAHKHGITVTVGFWLGHERHGFDYSDQEALKKQLAHCREAVRKYKDHPALLMWAAGNEMEGGGTNPEIWKHVNDVAKMCKQEDPGRPVMTVVAELWEEKIKNFNKYCPEVDIFGINTYGGCGSSGKRYREAGGTKPYVLTEYGPPGQWEMKKNDWGAINEFTSTKKAWWYKDECYKKGILSDDGLCIGSYVFIWGFKQEATATWYGLFLKDGSRLQTVESMQEMWGGDPFGNLCPRVEEITIDKNPRLKPGDFLRAKIEATDPDGDKLDIRWIMRQDSGNYATGGDDQPDQPEFPETILVNLGSEAEIKMPEGGGAYRLFAYVYDGNGNAAVANIPLYVEGPVMAPKLAKMNMPFYVYSDESESRPYIPSGYMGNAGDIKVNDAYTDQPFKGSKCIRVNFTSSDGWGGVVWQSPANDWGDQPGGFDLGNANVLKFAARADVPGTKVEFGMGMIGSDKPYWDSVKNSIPCELDTTWKEYAISFAGQNLGHIKSGFFWSFGAQGQGMTFYVDEVRYEFDSSLPPAGESKAQGTVISQQEKTEKKVASTENQNVTATEGKLPFPVYQDGLNPWPFIPSGYMGNTGAISLDPKSTVQPHSGATCLKVTYNASDNWGGVAWQSPANDWGDKPGGFNLTGATRFSFWARGDRGGERVKFGVGVIGSDKPYYDTCQKEYGEVVLTTEWTQYTLSLVGEDLSRIKTGFFFSFGGQGQPFTFYLDDIVFDSESQVGTAVPAVRTFASGALGGIAAAGFPLAVNFPYAVYKDGLDPWPYAPSGFMGNTSGIMMDTKYATGPHSGATCLQVTYTAPDNWAGVVWQSPANDWGDQAGGQDLTGATQLSFWARGYEGGEKVKFIVGIIGADKPFSDTCRKELEIALTKEWKKYAIPLQGEDLSRIKTGFGFVFGGLGKQFTFYVDDVFYETGLVTPPPAAPASNAGAVKKVTLPFAVYKDGAKMPYAPSGHMGNTSSISLKKSTEQPHTGESCMKVSYSAVDNWGGVAWQNPANDWGDKPGGFNLTGATKLSFWARGEKGSEKVKFVMGMIKSDKPHHDTAHKQLEVVLTTEWTKYEIPLQGENLSCLKTGFGFVFGGQGTPFAFYLDDVVYE